MVQWLASGERGISSNTLFTELTGVDALGTWMRSHPHDPSDFRRCLQLLEIAPELRPKLFQMRSVSKEWERLVGHWPKIEKTLREESDFSGTAIGLEPAAPNTRALMYRILKGAAC